MGVAPVGEHEVRGARVRIRRLPVVAALLVVTLGFYYWIWYYRVNRELRDYGRAFGPPNPLDVDLRSAMLAVTVGGIVLVPAAISVARTFERIVRGERLSGAAEALSSGVGLALFVVALVLSALAVLGLVGVVPLGEAARLVLNLGAIAALGIKLAYTQHHVNAIWRRELTGAA